MLRLIQGSSTDKAIVIGNLVEQERREIPAGIGHGIDLLAHYSIGEQRSKLRFLLSSERLLRTGDTDKRHRCFPFVLTLRLHERACHNAMARPADVRATPQRMHLALSHPSIRRKRDESAM